METIYQTAEAAARHAREAYAFSANAYTFEALNTALLMLKNMEEKRDLLDQRMSY